MCLQELESRLAARFASPYIVPNVEFGTSIGCTRFVALVKQAHATNV
jgi:hypothetical protein